ncbi:MAG: FHA domain-containing serine/threonine-protein kinase [Planctomycetota bacterium]
MPLLRVSFDGKTVEVPLAKSPMTVGRQPGLDLTVPAKGASREHLRLGKLQDGSWAAKDLDSTNGTLLNGERLQQARLKDGDRLQIGNCVMEFVDTAAPEPVEEPKPAKPKEPIVLVSKKDKARSRKPIAPTRPKPERKTEKTPEPPPEPDTPAERIESEEQLQGLLKDREAFQSALSKGDTRYLFGRYRLTKCLQEGGMGVVFKAQHTRGGHQVALKVLKSDRVDEQAIARFKQEAWAISAFDHPNIVKVRDLAMHGGMHFIAMEFIDGEDLLRAGFQRNLTFWQVADIVDKLADVLALVHGRNIWHRDIKPQNVILDREDEIKLIDFGIATVEREQEDSTRTAEGLIMGTPAFLSPEQIARGKMGAVDGRADLYSLGAVMYYLLTGRRPFTGKSNVEILAANMKTDPPHPCDVDEHVPEGLAEVAMKLMRKHPTERYQSANRLREAIAQWRKSADGKEELGRHKKILKLRAKKAKASRA